MKRKKGLYTILIITIALLIIIFAIPNFFSTKVGTRFLLKRIESKINAKIDVESFKLSWLGPQTIKNLVYKDANLDLQIDSLISNMNLFIFYKSFHTYKKFKFLANTQINDLNVHFHYPNVAQASIYNVFASIKATNKGVNTIDIRGKTKEDNKTGNIQANIDFINDKINSKILGTNIPTIGIDRLLFFNNKKYQNILVQLLGPSFDIEIDSILENKSGPIDINLNSTYSKAKLNLLYQKDKITLKKAATIIINLPGINSTFIKNINYIKSVEPITIKISDKDFVLPISPFKLDKLNLKQATIDLNKMIISNTSIIRTITNLAKMPSSQVVSIWFTNVNIQIDNKNLYSDRIDFLINDEIHLCLWGKVDLFDHNIKLNLGIPSDTLLSVFGIQNLPKDYVIKIPIHGTLENPKIDVKKATTKILALSTLQSRKGLGPIIGGVITRMQKDEDIPPAKRPYPWEGKIKKNSTIHQPVDLDSIYDLFK